MASFSAVRNGLKTRLQTITSPVWEVYATAPDEVVTPCAVVVPGETPVVYDVTFDGADDFDFIVTVLVGTAFDEVAQSNLDAYLVDPGAQSVKAALEGDQTLGGVAAFVICRQAGYGPVEYAGQRYLGATFAVEVGT